MPRPRFLRAIAVTVAALAVLTALVLGGAMNGIDEWALDHLMPALDPTAPGRGLVLGTGLWQPFPLGVSWWQVLLDLYNYPGSAVASAAIAAFACLVLVRRGQRWPALVWLGAWLVGNGIEVIGKHELTRPSVYWHERVHVAPFDKSYPSGHTVRSVVIAALIAYVWPRLRWPAAVWILFVPAALVISAAHTISDVVGGLLLGLLLVLLADAIIRVWTPSPTSSNSSSGESWETRSPSSPTSPAGASSFPPAS
jgi:membrane-associated phospholipid phosphatase